MRVLAVIGVLAIVIAAAGVVYFLGGFYNVAALEPDNSVVAWAIGRVREASIERRVPAALPAGLDDPATIEAGARALPLAAASRAMGHPALIGLNFRKACVLMRQTSTMLLKLFQLPRYSG